MKKTGNDTNPGSESLANDFIFNSLLVFILALVFLAFFQMAKHNPLVGKINPFANDPYDAAGSLATLLALLTAGMSLFQAFRLRSAGGASEQRKKLVVARIQLTSVLAVGVTLFADLVAMGQQFSLWQGSNGGTLLVLLMTLMTLACALVAILVVRTGQGKSDYSWRTWITIAGIAALSAIALASYPTSLRDGSTAGALGAIADGDIVLLMLMRFLVMALVPFSTSSEKRMYWWPQVIVFGLVVGFLFSLLERFAEGGQLLIATVLFTLAWCFGICLGYAFLAQPLGLYSVKEA